MNKNFIVEYVKSKINSSEENKSLIQQIEDAKIEMECAWEVFNYVSDPKLIEVAIYAEQAARTKYEYLLCEAKKNGVKRSYDEVFLKLCK